MDLPLVYVVILGWNRQKDTLECIESLLATDYSNLKLLVVDNASTDRTPERIRASFPQVELIINKENLGFAAGNNVGIQYAVHQGADYVLLLNNDTVVAEDLVHTLVTMAQSDHRIGVLSPKIYFYHDGTRIWSAGAKKPLLLPGLKRVGFGKEDGPAYDRLQEVEYTTACAILVRAVVFQEVGLLDPTYFMYYEDCDFSVRVRRAAYKIIYVPKAKVWHKDPRSTKEISPTRWYYLARSTVPFCLRYRRFPYLSSILYVGWVAARECLKGNAKVVEPCFRGLRHGLSEARAGSGRF